MQSEPPARGPYWPDAQSVHATVGAIENRPVAQGVHVVAPGSVAVSVTDPAAQFVQVVLPAEAENEPAEQSVHATVGAAENCPAAQGVHVDAPD